MIEQSFGLLFYLKKLSGFIKEEVTIYLRITVDGQSAELSTERKCDPLRWNQHAGRATGSKDSTKNLNAYLDTLQEKVYEIKRKLIDRSKPITAVIIRDTLSGKKDIHDKSRMLLEIFQHHNDQIAALVGKGYAPGALTRYTTSLKHTRSFIDMLGHKNIRTRQHYAKIVDNKISTDMKRLMEKLGNWSWNWDITSSYQSEIKHRS